MSYIPKSNIKISKTSGNEYVYANNKETYYSGNYIATAEGRYFVGNDPLNLKIEIVKKKDPPIPRQKPQNKGKLTFGNSNSFKKHTKLKGGIYNKLKHNKPLPVTKNYPSEKDYEKGFITRYFAKRLNSQFDYIEISQNTFNSIQSKKPEYDYNLYGVGKIKWSLRADAWVSNAKQLALAEKRGYGQLINLFPVLNEFYKTTSYDIKDRKYPDGEDIPSNLPPSYNLPPNNNYQVVEGVIMSNTNPKCANCIFRQEGEQFNHCKKFNNAKIRKHYWCKSWGPNITARDISSYNIDEEDFFNYLNNLELKDEIKDTSNENIYIENNRPTGGSMGTSNRPIGGGTSGGGGGGY